MVTNGFVMANNRPIPVDIVRIKRNGILRSSRYSGPGDDGEGEKQGPEGRSQVGEASNIIEIKWKLGKDEKFYSSLPSYHVPYTPLFRKVLIIENSNEERPHFTGNCILYFSPWMKIEDIIKFVYGEMPNEDYERIKHVAFQHQLWRNSSEELIKVMKRFRRLRRMTLVAKDGPKKDHGPHDDLEFVCPGTAQKNEQMDLLQELRSAKLFHVKDGKIMCIRRNGKLCDPDQKTFRSQTPGMAFTQAREAGGSWGRKIIDFI